MAIVSKGSGGSIKFSGTGGGGISITSSGGGGGGGSPINPSSRGDLKLRFLGGDYSTFGPQWQWNAISPGSTNAIVYNASQWDIRANTATFGDGMVPSFNGQGSAFLKAFTANNYGPSASLDAPGGSTARSLYMVACINDLNLGDSPTRMFAYGDWWYGGAVGFKMEGGYLYGNCMNPSGDNSTKGAPITAGTPFVVSFTYAADSDLKDNPIYVNGTQGTYGAGSGGVITTQDVSSGAALAFQWKRGGGYDASQSPGAPFYVADVLIFNTEHDSSTRSGIESWLMTQYGL